MAISQAIAEQIRQDHRNAPWRAKTAVIEQWADLLGVSVNTIWKILDTGRERKKDVKKMAILEDVTRIVYQVKHRVHDSTSDLSTDQAYAIAKKENLLPEDAREYSVSSINRMANRLKLNQNKRRVQRFQAEYPNQMHHIDASTSQFFYVASKHSDGDYILKLHKPAKNYKNKPVPVHLRPWIYGVVDDYSGYVVARYTAAPGESAVDNLKFLEYAWSLTPDKPFHGLPESIKADKGPMMKGKVAEDLLARLGVVIDPSVPGAKEAHGKIERPWRTFWQRFEKQFLVLDDWEKIEIRLSELNQQLNIYLGDYYNKCLHRYEKNITREQAWRKINLFGGVRPLPAGAFSTAHHREERKVGADGTFTLGGKIYEVKGLHNAKVTVITSVLTDEMIVQEIATGEKFEVIEFKPNVIGEFTAHKETPYQKSKKAAKELRITTSLYEERKAPTNIVPIAPKVQPQQAFDQVFPGNSYQSVDEAMKDFMTLTRYFPEAGSEDRIQIEQLLIANKLDKSRIKDLATEYAICLAHEERRAGNV